jgi:hypothetical protein
MVDSQAERVRKISAAGPGPDADALRTAYLDLLKLALCDLTGSATRTVTWTGDRRVFSRQLTGEDQLGWRVEGKDWPEHGLSMVGLRRLDDLQACVESVLAEGVAGDLIEAGTWRGGAAMLMRATLDAHGANHRPVWIADSFQGFPLPEDGGATDDREMELHMSAIDYLAPTADEVRGYFARFGLDHDIHLVPGFFEETLHTLREHRWALVRLDSDSYKATRLSLEALYPGLAVGGYLVIDDYFHPYLPTACRRAVDDFRAERGIAEPVEQIDWNSARWRREAAEEELAPASPRFGDAAAPRAVAERTGATIPTDRELQLADELAGVRARLAEVEARLGALDRSPLAPAADWLRRRLQSGRAGRGTTE